MVSAELVIISSHFLLTSKLNSRGIGGTIPNGPGKNTVSVKHSNPN